MDERVKDFLAGRDANNLDALDLPVSLAGSIEWNDLAETKPRIVGGMLRNLALRTRRDVPFYRDHPLWKDIPLYDIEGIADLTSLPLISKDDIPGTGSPTTEGIHGFRAALLANKRLLVPENLDQIIARQEAANPDHEEILAWYGGRRVLEFSSGGTKGTGTITSLSYLTVEMEAHALARALRMNGFRSEESIACFYNDTHKGGLQLERAAEIMGMPFHSKSQIFRTLAQDQRYGDAIRGFQERCARQDFIGANEQYGETVREGIREYIRGNEIQIVESVQPPVCILGKNAKGAGLAFMDIYLGDPSAFDSVNHVFLTGSYIPQWAYERLQQDGQTVSTTWGASEVMALATHASRMGRNVNDLVATPFPTIGSVVRYKERGRERPQLERVNEEEMGLVLVTGVSGAGSTYINYQIGDLGTRTRGGYSEIRRTENADITGSCASDALGI